MNTNDLQAILKHFGYFIGKVNGIWDLNTEIALRKFQKDAGLLSLGQLDNNTLMKLELLKEQWELDEKLAYTE